MRLLFSCPPVVSNCLSDINSPSSSLHISGSLPSSSSVTGQCLDLPLSLSAGGCICFSRFFDGGSNKRKDYTSEHVHNYAFRGKFACMPGKKCCFLSGGLSASSWLLECSLSTLCDVSNSRLFLSGIMIELNPHMKLGFLPVWLGILA